MAEMVEIVKIGSSTVSVREDIADRVIAVCRRCKGFKTIWVTDCKSSNWPSLDGYFWVGHQATCPICAGHGLYYRDQIV